MTDLPLPAPAVDPAAYLTTLPKVALHVHLEGSMPAPTLLKLAEKHSVSLPAATPQQLREWLQFRDFSHFGEVYQSISRCIQTPEDIELLAYEFLQEQARQHIDHTEFTFTAWSTRATGNCLTPRILPRCTRRASGPSATLA